MKGRRDGTHGGDLLLRCHRTAAGDHGTSSAGSRQAISHGVCSQQAAPAEIFWQAQRDAGAAGDQRQVGASRADGHQVLVRDCVDDCIAMALRAQLGEACSNRIRALCDDAVIGQAHLAANLLLQHAHQAGVVHRCQRMIAHAGLIEEFVTNEQVAFVDRTAIGWKGRAGNREIGAERVHQRIGYRSDIALRRRVEGRAILRIKLLAAGLLQPA